MRKIIFIATIIPLLASCGQKTGYEVTGKIEGVSGVVEMFDQYGRRMAESPVNNGKFSFSGQVDEPTPVMLGRNGDMIAMFFLEDGKIKIMGDTEADLIEATGTPANNASTKYDRKFNEFVQAFLAENPEPDINIFMKESSMFAERAIDENRSNFFGIYLLSEMQRDWDGEKILGKLELFTPELRETSYAKALQTEAEIKRKSDIGKPYMDIALYDGEGKKQVLSSYTGEGKYVLLDFWASWCPQCMEETPNLKEVYSKFQKKGFEIYGVSLDQRQTPWLNAIETMQMDWVNVFHDSNGEVTGKYSIVSIPANFLIGPDGTIIAKNLRGAELVRTVEAIYE